MGRDIDITGETINMPAMTPQILPRDSAPTDKQLSAMGTLVLQQLKDTSIKHNDGDSFTYLWAHTLLSKGGSLLTAVGKSVMKRFADLSDFELTEAVSKMHDNLLKELINDSTNESKIPISRTATILGKYWPQKVTQLFSVEKAKDSIKRNPVILLDMIEVDPQSVAQLFGNDYSTMLHKELAIAIPAHIRAKNSAWLTDLLRHSTVDIQRIPYRIIFKALVDISSVDAHETIQAFLTKHHNHKDIARIRTAAQEIIDNNTPQIDELNIDTSSPEEVLKFVLDQRAAPKPDQTLKKLLSHFKSPAQLFDSLYHQITTTIRTNGSVMSQERRKPEFSTHRDPYVINKILIEVAKLFELDDSQVSFMRHLLDRQDLISHTVRQIILNGFSEANELKGSIGFDPTKVADQFMSLILNTGDDLPQVTRAFLAGALNLYKSYYGNTGIWGTLDTLLAGINGLLLIPEVSDLTPDQAAVNMGMPRTEVTNITNGRLPTPLTETQRLSVLGQRWGTGTHTQLDPFKEPAERLLRALGFTIQNFYYTMRGIGNVTHTTTFSVATPSKQQFNALTDSLGRITLESSKNNGELEDRVTLTPDLSSAWMAMELAGPAESLVADYLPPHTMGFAAFGVMGR